MSGVSCQTRADADQFDGLTPTTGFFSFANLQGLPRTTRAVLTSLSYVEDTAGPALTTTVQFWAVRPGGTPTERIPLGDGDAATGLLNANGNARLKLCGIVLPREPGEDGEHWNVMAITQNKTQTGTVCVDFVLCPYPDTGDHDSRDK